MSRTLAVVRRGAGLLAMSAVWSAHLMGGMAVGVAAGCDDRTSQERVRDRARQEITESEQQNRAWQEARERDIATVQRYQRWFARVRAIDHGTLGLPEILPESLIDGASRPATVSETFCKRVAKLRVGKPQPGAEQWVAMYREQVARWLGALVPRSFESYRVHYLAERQLARLACIARDGGPALHQALVGLLGIPTAHAEPTQEFAPDDIATTRLEDAIRYSAAIYAIKHSIDPDRGWSVLRALRSGESYFSHAAGKKFHSKAPPLSLGFDPDDDYHTARALLRNDLAGRKRMRTGNVRTVTP